jgi:hypothetical protein
MLLDVQHNGRDNDEDSATYGDSYDQLLANTGRRNSITCERRLHVSLAAVKYLISYNIRHVFDILQLRNDSSFYFRDSKINISSPPR